MAATIGGRIVLDGADTYQKQLRAIESGLKANYSQMALVAEQYSAAGKSEDALKAKTEALNNVYDVQAQKVGVLQKRYDDAAAEYNKLKDELDKIAAAQGKDNEAYKETAEKLRHAADTANKYGSELNRAEIQLSKTKGQQDELNKELDNAQKHFISVADVCNGLTDALGVDLPPGADKAIGALSNVSAGAAGVVGVVAAVAVGLSDLTVETAKYADDLLTLATQTGLTTDQLQEFEYASERLDVSTDTLQGSLSKLTKNMASAKDKSGETSTAFDKLGVSIVDNNGHLRDNYDVFLEVIDALGEVGNETERDAIAMEIFGKSAQDLNPLIAAGSEELKKLSDEAHDVGYVIDEDTLGSFGDLSNQMDILDKKFATIKRSLATILLPVLIELADVAATVLDAIVRLTQGIADLVSKGIDKVSGFFGGSGVAGNARGTQYWRGGYTMVGEEGPEIVELPRGSRIYSHGQTPDGGSGGQTVNYYVTIDANRVTEFNDIVRIAQNEKMSIRQGVTG